MTEGKHNSEDQVRAIFERLRSEYPDAVAIGLLVATLLRGIEKSLDAIVENLPER